MFQNCKGEALFYNGLIIGILTYDPLTDVSLNYDNVAGYGPNPYSVLDQ